MPLTEFQKQIARLLAVNRSPDSHLAGGAALHLSVNSKRFSNDLDYFHDSVERVAEAFQKDHDLLLANKYSLKMEMKQPGYIRASVSKGKQATKIEWAHDSAWRFMPAMFNPEIGFQLHPVDIAINKVLALAGRDEARDFLDVLFINKEVLALGPLCWAAVGKDPGFSPLSLLELLKRRGKYRLEDFAPLMLSERVDLKMLKSEWLAALEAAELFIRNQSPEEPGCLYYSKAKDKFVDPHTEKETNSHDIVNHYGRPGGVLPQFSE